MRGLAAMFGAVLALPVAALAEQARGARAPEMPTLTTPWPAQDGCPRYDGVDISVDDRVTSVEWRGPNAAPLVFELSKLLGPQKRESYRVGSEGTDCHEGQSSCILYRPPVGHVLQVRAAVANRLLPSDFKAGALDELVLHEDVRGRGPRSGADAFLAFGLRLVLHCADTAKPSLAWLCDARSCVPRTFRDNVKMQEFWKAAKGAKPLPFAAGAYYGQWHRTGTSKDLTRLICMRGTSGRAEADRAARKENGLLVCEKTTPFAEARPLLFDLGRDLLRELDMRLEEGCAGACSARIDELRAVSRALAASSDLRLAGVRAVFRDSHDEFGYGAYPSLGWLASLTARAGSMEIACARRRTFTSMGLPDAEECRLTLYAHGRRLADYTPDWGPYVELPDGGAVRLLEWPPSHVFSGYRHDQIAIIGSALAQQPTAPARAH